MYNVYTRIDREKELKMPSVTIGKWGNSQAVTIPSSVYNLMGLTVGSKADVKYDLSSNSVIYQFEKPKKRYSRTKKMTMEEFTAGWTGPKVGEEWVGQDVGAEIVE